MRLAKRIAMISCLSRRQAEDAIFNGRICVNHEKVTTPVYLVTQEDQIFLDGVLLSPQKKEKVWKFYKPVQTLVTRSDPQGRPTIYDLLPSLPATERYISVGRLDYYSEGLLLLTNTPFLAHHLETHPYKRHYYVSVFGRIKPLYLKQLQEGLYLEGIYYAPCSVDILQEKNGHSLLEFVLTEGKNREIRKMCEWMNLKINRLIRHSYGPFTLDDLKPLDLVLAKNIFLDQGKIFY